MCGCPRWTGWRPPARSGPAARVSRRSRSSRRPRRPFPTASSMAATPACPTSWPSHCASPRWSRRSSGRLAATPRPPSPRASNWSPSPAGQQRLDREAGAAAAGGGGVGIVHAERGADQVVDEIDLGARQKRHRGRIDQHHRAVALDHQVIVCPRLLDVELVLQAGPPAPLDADPQHRTVALGLEDFPDAAGCALADDDTGCCHDLAPIADIYLIIWYPAFSIVKCGQRWNQL